VKCELLTRNISLVIDNGWEHSDDGINPFFLSSLSSDIDGPCVKDAKQVRDTQI